jgi:parallel beta-helix repeat protein
VLTCNLTVNSGVTLTLQAGTIIKPGASSVSLNIFGSLVSEGTESAPVNITSIKDDSVGGDTNGDGSATSPESGDLSRVYVISGFVDLAYTKMRYGGYSGGYTGIVHLYQNGRGLLDHCTISESVRAGIYLNAYAEGTTARLELVDSVVEENDIYGIHAYASGNQGTHLITVMNSTIRDNGYDGVYVYNENRTTITGSEISGNGSDGIYLGMMDKLELSGNTISGNVDYPVMLYFGGGNDLALSSNTLTGNGTDGYGVTGIVGSDTTLPVVPGYSYVSVNFSVSSGITLTLPAGLVI